MDKNTDLAPIVLFAYNRPLHTKATIDALKKNVLARESELYLFFDGPKDQFDLQSVEETRLIANGLSGFKEVFVTFRDQNFGLAKSIIDGVGAVLDDSDRVIVLEDDIVVGEDFLLFMNQALSFYKDSGKVWHISGWSYPIESEALGDAFLWRVMNCWGWATWKDRWRHFKKNPEEILKSWDKAKINRFNLDGCHNFFSQIESNMDGKLNTWAIFWFATIFSNDGLCLNAASTLVENIGHDGSGTNCGSTNIYGKPSRSAKKNFSFPDSFEENAIAVERIKKFLQASRSSFSQKLQRKIRKVLGL